MAGRIDRPTCPRHRGAHLQLDGACFLCAGEELAAADVVRRAARGVPKRAARSLFGNADDLGEAPEVDEDDDDAPAVPEPDPAH
jgi:hypothetical protein